MQSEATLRELGTATEIELCEMLVLLKDVQHCMLAMKLWFGKYPPTSQAQTIDENTVVADALFRDAVIQFVGCFDRSAAHSLDAEAVFKNVDGGVDYIRWLTSIRNSYAAHKFGSLRQCVAGVAVDKSGNVMGWGHFHQAAFPVSGDQEELMLQCISVVGRYLEARIKVLGEKLLAEAALLTSNELLALPVARTVVPKTNEIRLSRTRLRTRSRNSQK